MYAVCDIYFITMLGQTFMVVSLLAQPPGFLQLSGLNSLGFLASSET